VDCRGEQAADRSPLSRARSVLSTPIRAEQEKAAAAGVVYQYGGESESGLEPAGSPANWRCIVLGKLSKVRLLEDAWRTAPNHSRPASCVVDVDIDVEDQAEHALALARQ
jgi:hypothetical protein